MKKLLFILSLLFSTSLGHAAFDNDGPWHEWRTTSTCVAVSNFLVATGPVFLSQITITTGAPSSQFTYSNSSTTSNSDVSRSTSLAYDASPSGTTYPILTTLKNGFLFSKTGAGCVRFFWDWNGYTPKGLEGLGKQRP